MKLKLLAALAVIALAACSHANDEVRPEPYPVSQAPQPHRTPAHKPAQPPQDMVTDNSAPRRSVAPSPVYRPLANDQCSANGLQYLVGKPRTEIPVPLNPGNRRVVCSSCITTQEYRADRQTIVFDSDTGLIKSVSCG